MRDRFGPARKASLARELTKRFETVLHGDLGFLVESLVRESVQQKGEFVIMVAGAQPTIDSDASALLDVLTVLLAHVLVSKAAGIAAALTGTSKNKAYQAALEITKQS